MVSSSVSKRHSIACLFQDLCPFWVVHWVRAKNVVCIFGTKRIYRFLILNRSSWGDKPQKTMVCQPLGGMQLKCHPCSPPNKTIPISHGDWSVQWALPDPKMQRVSQTAVTTRPVSPKDSERLVDSRPQKKKLISSQSVTDQPQSPQLKMIGWII